MRWNLDHKNCQRQPNYEVELRLQILLLVQPCHSRQQSIKLGWNLDHETLVPVMISIFGSTSIPFPLYFAIHFPILFKSSFTISITKLFYFQPFYYSAFYYSAFYYSAFYYSAFLLFSLLLFSFSIIQLYY